MGGYGRRRSGLGFIQKVFLLLLFIGLVFLFRDSILEYLSDNPKTARYVPSFVTKALERDLEDWRKEDLQARATALSGEVQAWQESLVNAKDEGQARLEEVQNNLNQAREALEETKEALDKLSAAGEGLKEAVDLSE